MCDPMVKEISKPLRIEWKAKEYQARSRVRELRSARELVTRARDSMSLSKSLNVCYKIDTA